MGCPDRARLPSAGANTCACPASRKLRIPSGAMVHIVRFEESCMAVSIRYPSRPAVDRLRVRHGRRSTTPCARPGITIRSHARTVPRTQYAPVLLAVLPRAKARNVRAESSLEVGADVASLRARQDGEQHGCVLCAGHGSRMRANGDTGSRVGWRGPTTSPDAEAIHRCLGRISDRNCHAGLLIPGCANHGSRHSPELAGCRACGRVRAGCGQPGTDQGIPCPAGHDTENASTDRQGRRTAQTGAGISG